MAGTTKCSYAFCDKNKQRKYLFALLLIQWSVNGILKDCFLPQEDPAGLVHLLILTYVSSVVMKQMQQTILPRG